MFETDVNLTIGREFENQKTELVAIKNYIAKDNFEYNKIFISENDKIIPTKNQINYWNKQRQWHLSQVQQSLPIPTIAAVALR